VDNFLILCILLSRLIQGKAVSDHVLPTALKLLRHRDEGPVPVEDWSEVLIATMPTISTGTFVTCVSHFSNFISYLFCSSL